MCIELEKNKGVSGAGIGLWMASQCCAKVVYNGG